MRLIPISYENVNDLDRTTYGSMSADERLAMIKESLNKSHNDAYFEVLVVFKNDVVVGFMNLFAHSKHIISCGPTIKEDYRKKGFAYKAETLALEYAKNLGYTIAVGGVDDENTASIALHEKLGFELDRKYKNNKGRTIRLYIKAL